MLTDTHCRNAKPKPKLYRLTDHRGLCLEVKPSGVKAWRYRFTLEGKASMFALGEYPAVSLAEARDRCEAARQLVKQGINPAQQRQIDRIKQASDAEITFEKVAREWLQTKDWEDVTKNRRLDMLERVVFGEIGQTYGKSAAQVVLRWILQKGVSINTMSTKRKNIQDNFNVMDFTLSNIDMARIDALTSTNYRIVGKDLVPFAPDFD